MPQSQSPAFSMQPAQGQQPQSDPGVGKAVTQSPGAQKLLAPNPVLQKIMAVRMSSLDNDQAQKFIQMLTPDTIPVMQKILPELAPVYATAANAAGSGGPGMGQQDGVANMACNPSNGPGCSPSAAGGDPASKMGFASGGLLSNQDMGWTANRGGMVRAGQNGGMPVRTGEVNKGIPASSFARGGVPTIARAPAPMSVARSTPAFDKVNSAHYNNPKFAQGGFLHGYACGGPAQGQPGQPQGLAAPQTGPTGNPDTDQAIQNQQQAQQIVPAGGTNDSEHARVSKGEFIVDAPTVMYWGLGKFTNMQEKAHEAIVQHMDKQNAQQNQDQGQPQQQTQPQPQQQPQGLAAPPPQAPPSSMPNATEQRIQQTNSPRPSNPFSLAG